MIIGWCTVNIARWQLDEPGKISCINRSDPRCWESFIQVHLTSCTYKMLVALELLRVFKVQDVIVLVFFV